ncbi:phosphatidylglycerophosphatase C [Motilibacter rhizosphaerae]|uniref:Phosphatidylglycerophosphatase C n=1 Tax=Motilibacter rhizosphaerae TaxID=598652 RepID=A0A4Q7N7B5_9ACTN|nr:HAD family hydrolase [Motilibacter rhizosphaerae]RZS77535.1 phosphatidylglycerophosphatase C [Motilibacter rhizosphaerae]
MTRPQQDNADDTASWRPFVVPATPTLTLFDLDGVLSRRDTMAALVRRRLRQRPQSLATVVPLALLSRLLPAAGELRPAVHRAIVRIALRGLRRDEYDRLAHAVSQHLAEPGNAPESALQELRVAAQAGAVMVVTASEALLARSYLDALGLERVPVLASHLQEHDGQLRLAPHNVGHRKVRALLALGVTPSAAHLYTDSPSDLPLASQSARTTLVNASARLERVFSRRVATLDTIRW